jgi:hypothetical protein
MPARSPARCGRAFSVFSTRTKRGKEGSKGSKIQWKTGDEWTVRFRDALRFFCHGFGPGESTQEARIGMESSYRRRIVSSLPGPCIVCVLFWYLIHSHRQMVPRSHHLRSSSGRWENSISRCSGRTLQIYEAVVQQKSEMLYVPESLRSSTAAEGIRSTRSSEDKSNHPACAPHP